MYKTIGACALILSEISKSFVFLSKLIKTQIINRPHQKINSDMVLLLLSFKKSLLVCIPCFFYLFYAILANHYTRQLKINIWQNIFFLTFLAPGKAIVVNIYIVNNMQFDFTTTLRTWFNLHIYPPILVVVFRFANISFLFFL